MVTGKNTSDEVRNVKKGSVELFGKGDFILHMWNSNVSALESVNVDRESEMTYVKPRFSHNESETKILGLGWNKSSDKIYVVIRSMKEKKAIKDTYQVNLPPCIILSV